MGKYEKKRKKSPLGAVALVAVILIVLILLAIFVMPGVLYGLRGEDTGDSQLSTGENGATDDTTAPPTEENTVDLAGQVTDWVTFPLELENGALVIDSLLQFDGINPDCGNENGSNIAAIVVTNQSDRHLSGADISMVTQEGKLLRFVITHLPAGKSVMAFATDNASIPKDIPCGNVTCEASFDDAASMLSDAVTATVAGTHITLENGTDSALNDLVVYCHCTLGDQYFGGITYTYTIEQLAAGQTAALDAVDCILGLAEIVQITANQP